MESPLSERAQTILQREKLNYVIKRTGVTKGKSISRKIAFDKRTCCALIREKFIPVCEKNDFKSCSFYFQRVTAVTGGKKENPTVIISFLRLILKLQYLLDFSLLFHPRSSPMKGTIIVIFLLLASATPTGQWVTRHPLDNNSWYFTRLEIHNGK